MPYSSPYLLYQQDSFCICTTSTIHGYYSDSPFSRSLHYIVMHVFRLTSFVPRNNGRSSMGIHHHLNMPSISSWSGSEDGGSYQFHARLFTLNIYRLGPLFLSIPRIILFAHILSSFLVYDVYIGRVSFFLSRLCFSLVLTLLSFSSCIFQNHDFLLLLFLSLSLLSWVMNDLCCIYLW